MPESKTCPQCGAELPANAPSGICPKCLMRAGLAGADESREATSGSGFAQTTPQPGRFVPPEPESLAPHFPHLEISELLGHGGMGAVYKARQTKLDRQVALKIMRPASADAQTFAERFNREARTLARLSHPHIVAVHDFGEVTLSDTEGDGTPRTLYYFLMEYVDGANLRHLIQGGELQSEQALAIIPQICEALQFAHDEGIVHRDIKPENVLLDQRGRVKIADFGLAKLTARSEQDHTLTGTHQVMGTPRYMAPEQMEGSHTVDHRADIYSLGVVFYEMLTGQVPAGHFDPPSKKVQVDVRLDDVVLRSLARDPDRRYQHASDVKTDVESISQSDTGMRDAISESDKPQTGRADLAAGNFDPVRQVHLVATTLFIVGLVEWILVPLIAAVIVLWTWNFGSADRKRVLFNPLGSDLGVTIVSVLGAMIVLSTVLLFAAMQMRRLKFYWLAIAGSVIAMLLVPANLAGVPIGIWSLVVLTGREVRELFTPVGVWEFVLQCSQKIRAWFSAKGDDAESSKSTDIGKP